jgi:lipopolysaccharide export system permease protein
MLPTMCIIDRYLLRQFVQTFLICFLSLTGLYIVFDVFSNLDQFVRCGQKAGGVLPFMAHYYRHRWLLVFDLTSGTLAMISAMFTLAWIQRHNEMTALMSAGVSRFRVLIPIIAAVAAVSLLSAANRELVIPRYRDDLARRPQDPLGDQPQWLTSVYDSQTDVQLGGKSTYVDQKRIEEPRFLIRSLALRQYGNQLVADNAYYRPPEDGRPGGYLLDGVHEPKNLDSRPSLSQGGEVVLITPYDAPDWLKPKLKPNQCFLCSGVDFELLTRDGAKDLKQLSSTPQLVRALRNPSLDFGADVRVAIHGRIVKPLLDLTLLFLGLPLVVSREDRNVFIAVGLCILVTFAFTGAVMGLQMLGEASYLLSPALAAWAPLMIFVPVAVGLSESLWK